MSIQETIQHIEQKADVMIQNPKIQAVAGSTLVATPLWLSQFQTWIGFFTLCCGAVIGAHGVYKIFKPIVLGWFNKS